MGSAINEFLREHSGVDNLSSTSTTILIDHNTRGGESSIAEPNDEDAASGGDVSFSHLSSPGAGRKRPVNRSISNACAICLTRRPNCVLFPCKHMRCCSHCAIRLEHCPICRAVILERTTVYL